MTTWKLQKLCYYSQAWTLAWTDDPLFEEDFQAWENGPVCRELYDAHKGLFLIDTMDLREGKSTELTDDEKEMIDIVLESYGDKLSDWLRQKTHEERPWQIARGDLQECEHCEVTITKDSMREYYEGL
ncbi:MAG: DUF4065 domain-containing protein [Christensenellaceae bacterium]|nr:DUF4065 domain-containing protein [Christensenellaceae bacterium]